MKVLLKELGLEKQVQKVWHQHSKADSNISQANKLSMGNNEQKEPTASYTWIGCISQLTKIQIYKKNKMERKNNCNIHEIQRN